MVRYCSGRSESGRWRRTCIIASSDGPMSFSVVKFYYGCTTQLLSSLLGPITQLIWKHLAEEITDWKLSTNEHSAKVLLLWNNPFVIEALNRSKGAIHVMKRKVRLRQHGGFAMYVRILGLRQGTEGQCWTLSREYSAYSKESAGPFRTREYSAHGKNSAGPSLRQRGGFAMYA